MTQVNDATDHGPADRLKAEARNLAGAFAERAVNSARGKVESTTGRLTAYAAGQGAESLKETVTGVAKDIVGATAKDVVSGVTEAATDGKGPVRSLVGAGLSRVKDKVAGVFGGGGGGGGGKKIKLTNIVESIDVGVPIRVAYNQWTEFADFPTFMKKVENVKQEEETVTNWKAQVFWSHRTWKATIIDQHPDERIVWRSEGEKGRVDGAVTFHELTPTLTKIVVVLEYHPQGLFERTGNLWRAQGRRVRLELKHFQRHVTSNTLLNPDEVKGWRGVIEDSEVVENHETDQEEEGRDRDAAATGDPGGGDGEAAEETRPRRKRSAGRAGQEQPRATDDSDERRVVPRPRQPARAGGRERASQGSSSRQGAAAADRDSRALRKGTAG